mmetsp:Transcript_15271/g.38283  ORF Transcript_15271/g.38283 Transcript_15271/m.38283 type:complete len:270 (-) Transcript_15271:212-1021(-)
MSSHPTTASAKLATRSVRSPTSCVVVPSSWKLGEERKDMTTAQPRLATPAPTKSRLASKSPHPNQPSTSGVVIVSCTAKPLKCAKKMKMHAQMARARLPCTFSLLTSSSSLALPPTSSKQHVVIVYMITFKMATNQPCFVYALSVRYPSETSGVWLTRAAKVGPQMNPRHAKEDSLLVSSVRRCGGAATERYACSTACCPPEPIPCTSLATSTTRGPNLCHPILKIRSASPYDVAPQKASAAQSCSVRLVPRRTESAPRANEPIASPIE